MASLKIVDCILGLKMISKEILVYISKKLGWFDSPSDSLLYNNCLIEEAELKSPHILCLAL